MSDQPTPPTPPPADPVDGQAAPQGATPVPPQPVVRPGEKIPDGGIDPTAVFASPPPPPPPPPGAGDDGQAPQDSKRSW